jgi:hypothetical protein
MHHHLRLLAILLCSLSLGSVALAEPLGAVEADRRRIAAHLQRVERELREVDDSALSPALRAERRRNLERLRAYRLRGEFPRNHDIDEPRLPTFIDHDDRACAVGALMIASGHGALARTVARNENHARVRDIETPGVAAWVAQSGLTLAEHARIQPSYCEDGLCTSDDTPVCGESGTSYGCLEILEQCSDDTFVSEGECPYTGPPETTGSGASAPEPTSNEDGCAATGTGETTGWNWLCVVALALLSSARRKE